MRKRKRRCRIVMFCLFLSLASCAELRAQVMQAVRGRVVDSKTLEPIEYAGVGIRSGAKLLNVVTDARGYFQVPDVAVGYVDVMVSYVGYESYGAHNVEVRSGKETFLEIGLEQGVTALDELVVRAEVNKTMALNPMNLTGARILSPEEANRYAGAMGDISRMASNYAGVMSSDDSRNDIIVRGNSPMGVLWRLDGFEIGNPNHFASSGATGGPIGMLNNNQLTHSDFLTGGFSAEYGNMTAAVMDLKLRNGNNSKHEYLASFGMNGLEVGAEGYFSKKSEASYMVNVRKSFLQLLYGMGVDFGTKGAVPDYQDLSAKVNIPLRNGNLSMVVLLGASNIHMVPEMDDPEQFEPNDWGQEVYTTSHLLFGGVNYTARLSSDSRLENRFSFQQSNIYLDVNSVPFDQGAKRAVMNSNTTENRYSWMSTYFKRFNPQHFFQAGVGGDLFDLRMTENAMMKGGVPLDQNISEPSGLIRAYAQDQIRIGNDVTIIPGLYTQYYTRSREASVEPRLTMRWRIAPSLSLSGGTGLSSQLQNKVIYFYRNAEGGVLNERIKSTKNWGSSVALDWTFAPLWRLKSEFYYQHLYDVPITEVYPAQSILNMGDEWYTDWNMTFVNQGRGRNYGVELTLERFFSRSFYLLLTASLYESKYTPLDGVERNTKFNGNFGVNLLGGYEWKIGANSLIQINSKIRWIGGKRMLIRTSAYNPSGGSEWLYDWDNAYTQRTTDYVRLDLNAAFKINFKPLAVEWYLEMNNLTNHRNILNQEVLVSPNGKHKTMTTYQMGMNFMGGVRVYF